MSKSKVKDVQMHITTDAQWKDVSKESPIVCAHPSPAPLSHQVNVIPGPEDVNAHPAGASPYGVLDMVGILQTRIRIRIRMTYLTPYTVGRWVTSGNTRMSSETITPGPYS